MSEEPYRYGVWIVTRERWARIPGLPQLARFRKWQSAVNAAQYFQGEYPNEKFEPAVFSEIENGEL